MWLLTSSLAPPYYATQIAEVLYFLNDFRFQHYSKNCNEYGTSKPVSIDL